MQDLIKFDESAKTVTKIGAKGGSTVRLMNRKEFKEDYLAKNPNASVAVVKARYAEYFRSSAKGNTALLAAALTSGQIGVVSKSINSAGDRMRATFVDLSGKAETVLSELKALSPEELQKVMEYCKENIPAAPAKPAPTSAPAK